MNEYVKIIKSGRVAHGPFDVVRTANINRDWRLYLNMLYKKTTKTKERIFSIRSYVQL